MIKVILNPDSFCMLHLWNSLVKKSCICGLLYKISKWLLLIMIFGLRPKVLQYVIKLWIIIQTHIRDTDSYSDTDSENLHISLSNQWFSLNVIKVSQRVANDQIINGKTSLQKFVILLIIRGVSPTWRQAQ